MMRRLGGAVRGGAGSVGSGLAVLAPAPPRTAPGYDGIGPGAFAQQTTGTLTPGLPTGIQPDDVMVVVVCQRGDPAWRAAGWTLVTQVAAFGSQGLTVMWRRHVAGDVAPVGAFDGNSCARIMGFRGCKRTGTPLEALATGQDASADTAFAAVGVTTLDVARRVVIAAARDVDDASAWLSGWSAPGLADFVEHFDQGSTFGLGTGIALASGVAPAAGAVGPFAAAIPFAAADAWAVFALIPSR